MSYLKDVVCYVFILSLLFSNGSKWMKSWILKQQAQGAFSFSIPLSVH